MHVGVKYTGLLLALGGTLYGASLYAYTFEYTTPPPSTEEVQTVLSETVENSVEEAENVESALVVTTDKIRRIPFYSQFGDISDPEWKKVGCGIASLAMLIDYYTGLDESVDELLGRGRESGAYITSAGWSHAGLIKLSEAYGLNGSSNSLSHLSADEAFEKLIEVVEEGPVMVSVYYTFTPGHPIPHLAVVTDIKDGLVYYNDPADPKGNNSISIEKFKPAWKRRYIEIRPTS